MELTRIIKTGKKKALAKMQQNQILYYTADLNSNWYR